MKAVVWHGPDGDTWVPGDAPSLAARRAVRMAAKAGTIGTVGVYPPQVQHYPFGEAFMKNLTLRSGNCNHRRYLPGLVSMVDRREAGWPKVVLGVSDEGSVAPGLGEASGTGAAATAVSPGPLAAEATNVEVSGS